MNLTDYKVEYTQDDAPGWSTIDEAVKALDPGQKPKHRAAPPHYMPGGNDPVDGISIYESEFKGETYFHFVTYR